MKHSCRKREDLARPGVVNTANRDWVVHVEIHLLEDGYEAALGFHAF